MHQRGNLLYACYKEYSDATRVTAVPVSKTGHEFLLDKLSNYKMFLNLIVYPSYLTIKIRAIPPVRVGKSRGRSVVKVLKSKTGYCV